MTSQYDLGAAKVPACFTNATRTHASTYIHTYIMQVLQEYPYHTYTYTYIYIHISHRCCKSTCTIHAHKSTYIHHAGAARVPVPHIHIHIHLHTYTSCRCCKSATRMGLVLEKYHCSTKSNNATATRLLFVSIAKHKLCFGVSAFFWPTMISMAMACNGAKLKKNSCENFP